MPWAMPGVLRGEYRSICLPSVYSSHSPGTCPCLEENLTLWPCISSLYPEVGYILIFRAVPQEPSDT